MTKIICDTNIWFNLCVGVISPKVIGRNPLVFTQHCLQEILTNPSLVDDHERFVSICKTIIKYSNKYLLKSPLEYLLDIKVDISERQEIIKQIKKYAYNGNMYRSNSLIKTQRKNTINYFENQSKNSFIKNLNSQLILIKKNINDKNQKNKRRSLSLIEQRKQFVSSLCDNFTDSKGIARHPILWDNFLFFSTLIDEYFKKLETGEIVSVTIQDMDDLFHLAYITPKTKFWTYDKKWIWMVRDCGLEDFLFKDVFVEQKLKENLPKRKGV